MRFAAIVNSVLALALLAGSWTPVLANEPLKTGIRQDTRITPTLNRNDIKKMTNTDPFSNTDDDGELLDVPKANYRPQVQKPVVEQRKPLTAVINDQGSNLQPAQPNYAPQDMGGEPDAMPAQQQYPPQQPAFNPNDPDSSPDMQLAWDMWHKRVAQCIFERFNFFAKAAFRHSPPIMAKLTYTVTRDGQIINLNMPQKSTNVLFNVLVFQSVKSLNGDMSILAFPQGSRRMYVPKSGVFTQNYGNQAGFKYTVGDQETLRGGGRR